MRYREGDRVRIKSLDWYNENKSKSHGTVACGGKYFDYDMREWCGKIMTILTAYQTCYIMQEDGAKDLWTDEMIEGLVEEPLYKATVDKNGNMTGEFVKLKEENQKSELVPYFEEGTNKILYYKNKDTLECYFPMRTPEYICPEGYIFKDEDGNVINATKIFLEKKSKKSPKTDDIIKWLRKQDMTKYIGVIYSGMCSITFDTEGLIKDFLETVEDNE